MATLSPPEVLKREREKAEREKLEIALEVQLRAHNIRFEKQYRFHPTRKWRADFAMLNEQRKGLMVEVQGGIYSGGRHTRGDAIEDECEKFAYAIMLHWYVMPITAKQIANGSAIKWICQFMGVNR